MASLYYVLLSALVFDTGLTYIIELNERDNTESNYLQWPSEYHFKGETSVLSSGIVEQFEMWYSNESSRIEYFEGTVKEYYLTEEGDIYKYQIYPVTTEEETNDIICIVEPAKKWTTFLPAPDDFIYTGNLFFSGRTVNVWKKKTDDDDDGDYKLVETVYVYRDNDVDVPLYYEKQKHIAWNGAFFTHMITLYRNFSIPDSNDFDIVNEEACEDTKLSADINKADTAADLHVAFNRYKEHHNKYYTADDDETRTLIFKTNFKIIKEHNNKKLAYKMGVNEFTDQSEEELSHLTATWVEETGSVEGTERFGFTEAELEDIVSDLPENYDMRAEGYISKIKNQANCGSCWAFASIAAMEGALTRVNGGRNLDLSEQSLVDCAWGFSNEGCEGGWMTGALKYILKHGVPTEYDYGLYTNKDGFCHTDNSSEVFTIRGFGHVLEKSVNAMKVALYKYGPVVVAIHAGKNMKMYSSGIFYDPDCNKKGPNHAVVIVGYGVRDNTPYWIVKNSWGEQWGMDGYILLSAIDNNCHVLEHGYYPVV